MNLHIVPDNVFINKFYENLQELDILRNNRIVVRSNQSALKFVSHDLPFARLYSSAFNALTEKTQDYDKVFIHQFTPLLYRWVATHNFKELNWMVWGADLYSLSSVKTVLYEDLTFNRYVKEYFSIRDFFYRAKVWAFHDWYRNEAYMKVSNLLTWMTAEYDFAKHHLPSLGARHQFFFYENQLPYHALDKVMAESPGFTNHDRPTYILGNSAAPELNHLDAVAWMAREGVRANLMIPVSYGSHRYIRFLKNNLSFYKGGEIQFVERRMDIEAYLRFLYQADGLIMNNIRPQGYGNILMMMYFGKKVFLNEKNLSIPELNKRNLIWYPLREMKEYSERNVQQNRSAVLALLSHDTLLNVYRDLFS
jgi:dTDP-N-acetylfucosamine:lipid II N-acetylfucosaminyltransferase